MPQFSATLIAGEFNFRTHTRLVYAYGATTIAPMGEWGEGGFVKLPSQGRKRTGGGGICDEVRENNDAVCVDGR